MAFRRSGSFHNRIHCPPPGEHPFAGAALQPKSPIIAPARAAWVAPPAPPAAWFACAQVGGGSGAITGWCGGSPAPMKLYTAVRHCVFCTNGALVATKIAHTCNGSWLLAQLHTPDVLLLGGVKHVGGDLLGIAGPQLHTLHQELVLAVCRPRQRSEHCRAWRAFEGGRQLLAAPTSCLPQAPQNRCPNPGQRARQLVAMMCGAVLPLI